MQVEIVNADVMTWASEYGGPPAHAIMSDPPYHLVSTNKRFSGPNSAPAKFGKDGAFQRASKGFMGQDWDGLSEDGQGIAFKPATWAALGQHLYPGAWCFAYASSRGWHRLAVAIEDAGNIIQPAIWIYGYSTGFPKSTRIDSALDKRSGIEREIIGPNPNARPIDGNGSGYNGPTSHEPFLTIPATPLARAWQDHRYGGQVLAPSAEPIICFQKPYDGRPLNCIVETGAGSLNVGLGRIPTDEDLERISGGSDNAVGKWGFGAGHTTLQPNGRWPKNLILSHTRTCTRINGEWQCQPECVVRQMGEEYGERSSGGADGKRQATGRADWGMNAKLEHITQNGSAPDSGPVTRYFYQPHFSYEVFEQLSAGKQVLYVVKPGEAEREAGLNGHVKTTRNRVNAGGLENEPRFAPVTKANNHPTLKSLEANRYLCSLLAPPKEYAPRRLLIPFAGAGSEICGAILSGQWEEIIAIEQSEKYCEIAQARVNFWNSVKEEVWLKGIDEVLRKYGKINEVPKGQLSLF